MRENMFKYTYKYTLNERRNVGGVGHKTITVSEEAYKMLAGLKMEGESFTEVIKRVVDEVRRKPLSSFTGRWEGGAEELEGILMGIERVWTEYERSLEPGM